MAPRRFGSIMKVIDIPIILPLLYQPDYDLEMDFKSIHFGSWELGCSVIRLGNSRFRN